MIKINPNKVNPLYLKYQSDFSYSIDLFLSFKTSEQKKFYACILFLTHSFSLSPDNNVAVEQRVDEVAVLAASAMDSSCYS